MLSSSVNSKLPISIPIEMDIDLTILEVNEKSLHEVTSNFLRHFDLSRVKYVEETPELGRARERCGSRICKRARQDYDYWGVNFYMSGEVYSKLDCKDVGVVEGYSNLIDRLEPIKACHSGESDRPSLLRSMLHVLKHSRQYDIFYFYKTPYSFAMF